MWHLFHTSQLVDDTAISMHDIMLKRVSILFPNLWQIKSTRRRQKGGISRNKNTDFSEKSELATRSKGRNTYIWFCNILVSFSVGTKTTQFRSLQGHQLIEAQNKITNSKVWHSHYVRGKQNLIFYVRKNRS